MTEAAADQALRLAVEHHRAGRLKEAEQFYQEVLRNRPEDADANHNIGVLALQAKQTLLGLRHLQAALSAQPARGQFWLSYIRALMQAGEWESARRMLEQGRQHGLLGEAVDALADQLAEPVSRSVDDVPVPAELEFLATLSKRGNPGETEAAARAFAQRYPGHGFGWKLLGVALKQQGRLAEAVAPMRAAASLLPSDAGAHHNLSVALTQLGQLAEAETACRQAIAARPGFAEAHATLGAVLKEQSRLIEAEASLRCALEIQPDRAEWHFNLGDVLRQCGRTADAEATYRRAVAIKPDFADAYNSLGNTLLEQSRVIEAETNYRQALALQPDLATALANLGNALAKQDRLPEAEASYRRALEMQPHALEHAIHANLLLPNLPATPDAIARARQRYEDGLKALLDAPFGQAGPRDPGDILSPPAFQLAYQNRNDRPLMEALCRVFRLRLAGLSAAAPHLDGWLPPAARSARIKVGFISEFLGWHTIGKLYQGLIRQLDRSRFEVVVIHAPLTRHDGMRESIDAAADRAITLPRGLAAQQNAVAAEQLDVLFYPDVGMSPATYFLAYARLAAIQALGWGHPVSSGLDTLDYFISSKAIEPEDAISHYTETLICLNRLPGFYQPLIGPAEMPGRSALGLPETGTLYACPQTLFKFHPDFDAVLAEIAEGDPTGHILLLESHVATWTNLLRERWGRAFPILLERVRFLPRQPPDRFMALLAHVDVLLDPLHFGSGNTLYEGMVYGTPVVTWPGRFMRGRIVAGAYRQMGIADAPIAERIEDYAPLALALGRDPERRRVLRQASVAAATTGLFADRQAVREFETFLAAAVDAAGRGEKLPPGWRPDLSPREDA